MSSLLLAPHGDDEVLFAAFTCIRERPHVIVCTQDDDPEVRGPRSYETTCAITTLGCSHHEWPMSPKNFDLEQARTWLKLWDSPRHSTVPDKVYAPAVSEEGHEDHNLIGSLAVEVFGPARVIPYLTYGPRGQRQREGMEIVPTPAEIQRKLKALACYRTQIENAMTRPWFFDLLDLREWLSYER